MNRRLHHCPMAVLRLSGVITVAVATMTEPELEKMRMSGAACLMRTERKQPVSFGSIVLSSRAVSISLQLRALRMEALLLCGETMTAAVIMTAPELAAATIFGVIFIIMTEVKRLLSSGLIIISDHPSTSRM